MENKSHALAAGTFVLVVTALLVALAVWLTRDSRSLRLYELSSKDAVTGLQPQAAVRFKGVDIGKVTDIGFDRQVPGQVLIRIAVDEQAPITQSTFGTLGFQGVTGLAFVQLDDKGESKVALPAGDGSPARIPMRPSLLSTLSDRGLSILSQLDDATRQVNLLLSADNQKNLMGAIGNLSQAAASMEKLTTHTDQQVLPQLMKDAKTTLINLQDTSVRVGESADETRRSARAFRAVTERMGASGGTLDQLAQGVTTLAATGQNLNTATLPRVNHALEDAARTARQLSRAAGTINDNPQSLLYGNGPLLPGPGEPGFTNPGKP